MTARKNLIEGHQRNILAKLNWNWFSGFWQEDFQIFLSRYIGKISPTPKQLCFLTNQDCLNILGRGSPKQHLNRSGGIWQEEFQSFLYRYIRKISPTPTGGHVFWRIMKAWTFLVEGHPLRKHVNSNILKILLPKNENFQIKMSGIFLISARNIDCGYSLEPPQRGGSNKYPRTIYLSRNKRNNVYPCIPQFYYKKVGFKGVKII